jgi:hypothetical protein
MTLELLPLCSIDATLADPIFVGEGPSGLRLVIELLDVTITGERLSGSMLGKAAADWITIVGTVGTLDVRATIKTDDDAIVFCQYKGRTDVSSGTTGSLYVAPTFETSDPRYAWLNHIQAVGKGKTEGNQLHYDWYEVR